MELIQENLLMEVNYNLVEKEERSENECDKKII